MTTATPLSSPFCLYPPLLQQSLLLHTHLFKPPLSLPKSPHKLLLHKFNHSSTSSNFTPSCSSETPYFPTSESSYLTSDPLTTGRFLGTEEVDKLEILENFRYSHEFESGSLWVRVMRQPEMEITVGLLSESFADSMSMAFSYVPLLEFLVKQYLNERRALMPNTATLVGFFRGDDGQVELAGTVEVSFNKKGANASPPTPTPPKDSPYICNMTVRKSLRRRGIGWNLLKACEEVISQMRTSSREVYLHCRMIDIAPLNMYIKAGYSIVKTDNILILLTLQRRKHLMCKKLPDSDISSFEDNLVS